MSILGSSRCWIRPPWSWQTRTPLKLNPDPDLRDRAAAEKLEHPSIGLLTAGRRMPTEAPGEAGLATLAALRFELGSQRRRCDRAAHARLDRGDAGAAHAVVAASHARRSGGAGTRVDATQTIVEAPRSAQAARAELAPPEERTVTARLDLRRAPPPRPALKPGRIAAAGAIRMAARAQRRTGYARGCRHRSKPAGGPAGAWWSNLKILLASGPASSAMRAGGDDSDRQAGRGGIGAAVAASGAGAGGGRSDPGGGANAARGGGNDGATETIVVAARAAMVMAAAAPAPRTAAAGRPWAAAAAASLVTSAGSGRRIGGHRWWSRRLGHR